MARTLRRTLILVLIVSDALLVSCSWLLSYWLRVVTIPLFGYPINPFPIYIKALPIIVVPWLISCGAFGLYRRKRGMTPLEEFQALLQSVALGWSVVMAVAFMMKEFDLARSVVILFFFVTLLLLGIMRALFRNIESRLLATGRYSIRALIVGAGQIGIRALQRFRDHPEIGYEVIGFLDDDPKKKDMTVAKIPVLGAVKDLRRIVEKKKVEEVFVAISKLPHKRILQMIMECESLGVSFKIASDLFDVLAHETRIDFIEELPIFELRSGEREPGYEMVKRGMDFLVGGIVLLLSLPLWPFIMLAIVMESGLPIFFSQERVGKDGKVFRMFKFRTMFKAVRKFEPAPRDKEDPRITRVGRLLRRMSLDELPNIINVILGDMSLVGPRPEMPFIVEQYEDWQRKRLAVKPGITGLWQVLGRKDLPLQENLEYDFYYIKNRSFFLDLTILLKSVPIIFTGRGAY